MANLVCLGEDLNGKLYVKEVPNVLIDYVSEIQNAINKVFYSSYQVVVPREFINNMKSRGMLHKFIDKYITKFFDEIPTSKVLEDLVYKECLHIFDIKEVDTTFKKMYKNYNKGTSIESYLGRYFEKALVDYKRRLDEVEF